MESKLSRKEAINEFKARKVLQGVFAVRCTATGRVWVSSSRNLDATRTGLWFMLRNGSHINRALQAEWNAQGEETFQYESLETLDEDLSPMAASDLLKQKKRDWLGRLQAQAL
jgi:hypothetical protein